MGVIREGNFRDIDRVIEILKEHHGRSIYKDLVPSEHRVHQSLSAILRDPYHGFYVLEIDGRVEGAAIGFVARSLYAEERWLTDRLIVVSEKGRGRGLALIKRLKAWAKTMGAVRLLFSSQGGDESVDRLYSCIGLKQVGHLYSGEIG